MRILTKRGITATIANGYVRPQQDVKSQIGWAFKGSKYLLLTTSKGVYLKFIAATTFINAVKYYCINERVNLQDWHKVL